MEKAERSRTKGIMGDLAQYASVPLAADFDATVDGMEKVKGYKEERISGNSVLTVYWGDEAAEKLTAMGGRAGFDTIGMVVAGRGLLKLGKAAATSATAVKGMAAVEGGAAASIKATFDLALFIEAVGLYNAENGFVVKETPFLGDNPKSMDARAQQILGLSFIEILPMSSWDRGH